MLIGVAGRARVGKDTVVKYLVEKYGFNQIALADPVKKGSYAMDPWIAITDVEWNNLGLEPTLRNLAFYCEEEQVYFVKLQVLVDVLGVEKAKVICGVRQFYQKYGTEGGRDIHGEDCWLNIAKRQFTEQDAISDVRFSNEAEFVRENGGIVLNLVRNVKEEVAQHASENDLCSEYYDVLIDNNGTKEELYAQLDKLIA